MAPEEAKIPKKTRRNAADVIAATINMNGHLCWRLSEITPINEGQYAVRCIRSRHTGGQADYHVFARDSKVYEL